MKKFKKFYLEITSVCNLACSFCPPTERQKQFISVEDFSKRLDQIKPHTDYIYLHVKGEPLLHPKIEQLLDISHEKGFKVNITTNGTLINKKRPKGLYLFSYYLKVGVNFLHFPKDINLHNSDPVSFNISVIFPNDIF